MPGPNDDLPRAYLNKELTTEEKEELVAYNRVMRFGCAQFVDGKCVYLGKVPQEIILVVEKE